MLKEMKSGMFSDLYFIRNLENCLLGVYTSPLTQVSQLSSHMFRWIAQLFLKVWRYRGINRYDG